ncbi:MAG: hypothetical protein C0518_14890 [Opitutus sp.]|nr:hypothetical protein [Opitutus sp.]
MSDFAEPPEIGRRRAWLPWLVAVAAGALGWWGACWASGLKEAWDSAWYGKGAFPLFALVAGGLGYWQSGRAWRWPLGIAVGQMLGAVIVMREIPNLWPLSLVAFTVLSAPLLIPAVLGAKLRAWRDARR